MNTAGKTVIIIAGPTAVGKTSFAIELAQYLGTEIISADSRQCYKELKIGVARPSEKELERVTHHFIASHSIHEKVTASVFENYALKKLKNIFLEHDVAVMVGGTGLYIKVFCEGMDEMPEVPENIHNEIITSYNKNGLQWLQDEIKILDPEFYTHGEINNPQRCMRALEIYKTTGRSIESFKKRKIATRDFKLIKMALQLPKEELHANIKIRTDNMIKQGLEDEVRTLIPYRNLNALQTVGYKEMFDYFDGRLTLDEAVDEIKTNTQQYAKRQMTWFKRDKEFHWMHTDIEAIKNYLGI